MISIDVSSGSIKGERVDIDSPNEVNIGLGEGRRSVSHLNIDEKEAIMTSSVIGPDFEKSRRVV